VATTKQTQAAKRNIKKATSAAKKAKTITKLPKAVRQDLSRNAAAARRRGGNAGHSLDDRTREQLYEAAKRKNIAGRSKMGKYELIQALRKAG